MPDKDLDKLFEEAYERACNITSPLPPDVMLRIYAYYKQATVGMNMPNHYNTHNLRDAFKMNAWIQVSHLSREEAQQLYIETINSIIP